MQRVAAVFLLSLVMVLGGCLVRTHHPPRRSHQHYRSTPKHKHRRACPPSHYWDGSRCRHKGRGRGARKHDYR